MPGRRTGVDRKGYDAALSPDVLCLSAEHDLGAHLLVYSLQAYVWQSILTRRVVFGKRTFSVLTACRKRGTIAPVWLSFVRVHVRVERLFSIIIIGRP